MGRPEGSGTVEKHPEKQRLGCKYADQYYAGLLNIPEEKARESYKCATHWREVGRECPFGFLQDCIVDMPPGWANGVVVGMLQTKSLTCKMLPISYSGTAYTPDYIHYECSNCKGTIKGNVEFMSYCYKCGARIE